MSFCLILLKRFEGNFRHIADVSMREYMFVYQAIFVSAGGHHQAKAGQRPQEDPGAQGQVSRWWKGEGQIQGGDHWEDAGVKMIFCYQ